MCRTENEGKGGKKKFADWSGGGGIGSLGEGGVDDFMWRGGTGSGGSWFFSRIPSLSRLPFGSFPNSNIWRKMITLATLPRRLINNSTLSRSVGLERRKE